MAVLHRRACPAYGSTNSRLGGVVREESCLDQNV